MGWKYHGKITPCSHSADHVAPIDSRLRNMTHLTLIHLKLRLNRNWNVIYWTVHMWRIDVLFMSSRCISVKSFSMFSLVSIILVAPTCLTRMLSHMYQQFNYKRVFHSNQALLPYTLLGIPRTIHPHLNELWCLPISYLRQSSHSMFHPRMTCSPRRGTVGNQPRK